MGQARDAVKHPIRWGNDATVLFGDLKIGHSGTITHAIVASFFVIDVLAALAVWLRPDLWPRTWRKSRGT